MPAMDHIVLVGASAAGLTAADALRLEGFTGTLTMVGEELCPPYDRPPLSKHVLAGTLEPHKTTLRQDADLQRLRMDLKLGRRATHLDPAARTVTLADGDRLDFDGLIIATGLRPRRLPFGRDLAGVHVLRTLDEALTLRAQLLAGPRVVVIGAGFLGTEIAATTRSLGLDVTLVGIEPTPLAGQLGTQVGGLVADMHQENGVRLCMGRSVTDLLGAGGRVSAVVLDDDTLLPADVVVVAIGSVPAVDWLADSGLPLGDGVLCDSTCQVAPGIYAAGDVANWPHPSPANAPAWNNAPTPPNKPSPPPETSSPDPAARNPMHRSRSGGPTNTTPRSSSMAGARPMPASNTSTATHRHASSLRSTTPAAAS